MKVAFHIDQLWFEAPGGIGTYIDQLWWHHLARDPGVDVVPFFSRWRRRTPMFAPLTSDGRFPGVELASSIRVLYPSWAYLRRPALPSALADADIVHATNHAAIPPVRSGQKLVVTVHDLAFVRWPELIPPRWRRLYRRGLLVAIDEADQLLVPSWSVRQELIDAGAEPTRIAVTPLASAMELPDDAELERTREDVRDHGIAPPYVLAVGTIEPRKNLVRLVRTYRRLAGEGLPHALVLVGPHGWAAEDLEREIAKGGPGRVLRAQLGGDELAICYADADVVAYVSLYEGFGLPVLEAMSVGAPVVTSDVSSLPEVAGDAALLVDPNDERQIGDALRRVLTDPALAADLRRRGRARARGFSWARTAQETVDAYRRVLG